MNIALIGSGRVATCMGPQLKSLPEADVYLTMLTDDALVELAPAIVKGRENALFLHTAGSIAMDIWK